VPETPELPKRRRGRPRVGDLGRNAAITISVTRQMRERLEAAAATDDRSISQTAERLISSALDLAETGPAGPDIGHSISVMLRFAKMAAQSEGFEDFQVREMTRGGWHEIVDHALSYGQPSRNVRAAADACSRFASVCRDLNAAADAAVIQIADQPGDFPQIRAMLAATWHEVFPSDLPAEPQMISPRSFCAELAAKPSLITTGRLNSLVGRLSEIRAVGGPLTAALEATLADAAACQAATKLAEFERSSSRTFGRMLARRAMGIEDG
jgi:hypothetical protein